MGQAESQDEAGWVDGQGQDLTGAPGTMARSLGFLLRALGNMTGL